MCRFSHWPTFFPKDTLFFRNPSYNNSSSRATNVPRNMFQFYSYYYCYSINMERSITKKTHSDKLYYKCTKSCSLKAQQRGIHWSRYNKKQDKVFPFFLFWNFQTKSALSAAESQTKGMLPKSITAIPPGEQRSGLPGRPPTKLDETLWVFWSSWWNMNRI